MFACKNCVISMLFELALNVKYLHGEVRELLLSGVEDEKACQGKVTTYNI